MDWNCVDQARLEELCYVENLYDTEIAELYGISPGSVAYKRKKYGIKKGSEFAIAYCLRNMRGQPYEKANDVCRAQLL